MDKNRYGIPLEDEHLWELAPSVMNDVAAAPNLTDKYAFLPTIHLINDMRELGWFPYVADQRKPQVVFKNGKKKPMKLLKKQTAVRMHMVVFRNPTIGEKYDMTPEITLINSHDGRNSFRFYAGLYRKLSDTSIIIGDDTFEFFKVKHQGYSIEEIKKVINDVLEIIPGVFDKVSAMHEIVLKPQQQVVFATEAVRLRWKEGKEEVDLKDLLNPERGEDKDATLWNVFLNLQDKIVKGGIRYELRNGRKQTARKLVNIEQKIDIKRTLWKIASDIVTAYQKTHKKHEEQREAELV